jgi:hypothetical protein
MDQERGVTIHYMDGTKAHLRFPKQVKSDDSVSVRLERVLDKDALLLEVDGSLMIVPFSSIKYLQVSPAPNKLPDYVIKGGSLTG